MNEKNLLFTLSDLFNEKKIDLGEQKMQKNYLGKSLRACRTDLQSKQNNHE